MPETSNVIARLRLQLVDSANEKTRLSSERFFKEEVNIYGLKTADAMRISKEFFQEIKSSSKHEILNLCEELWLSGYIEESLIACNWAYNLRNQYQPEDFETFERWVKNYVSNWASCDTLCKHTIGIFIMQYPNFIDHLKDWTTSSNRWVRRASAVSFIIPARKGKFTSDIFTIAEALLMDKDDMVQKGYGWLLKVTSQVYLQLVFDFVMSNKSFMPRTALRYAIEKMPSGMKIQAMAK
ncbi:MAG: DNA alkylation repair protein [Sphingobacteriia bacterium]|nr:DNA alkylation repair protein [Sphingobacteriia bacterium]